MNFLSPSSGEGGHDVKGRKERGLYAFITTRGSRGEKKRGGEKKEKLCRIVSRGGGGWGEGGGFFFWGGGRGRGKQGKGGEEKGEFTFPRTATKKKKGKGSRSDFLLCVARERG